MSEMKRNIVVTGFGLFGDLVVNNSWKCVQSLKESNLEAENNVRLIIKEIPVVYEDSERIVQELWNEYDPLLMIHTGVHKEDSVVIESQAHSSGYSRVDVRNKCPPNGVCPVGEKEVIRSELDLKSIAQSDDCIKISSNAGRFLCEYTYYLSLCKDNRRSLFVHVPPCESCTPTDKIVDIIAKIIRCCLHQINSK